MSTTDRSELVKERNRLRRRQRDAYRRMEYWEKRHEYFSCQLSVLYGRFPDLIREERFNGKREVS